MNGTVSPSKVVVAAISAGIAALEDAPAEDEEPADSPYGLNSPSTVDMYTYSTRVSTEQFSSSGGPSVSPPAVVNRSVPQK